jgi:hypothetical protein
MREPRPSDWEQLVSTLLEDTDAALADVSKVSEGPEEASESPTASPQPDECPSPRPGTRMLEIPPASADPMRQAGESIERLKRKHSASVNADKKDDERKLLGYLLKSWEKGTVTEEREFPPTAKGKRAAERLKRQRKQKRPGRPGQAVTIRPIYEKSKGTD